MIIVASVALIFANHAGVPVNAHRTAVLHEAKGTQIAGLFGSEGGKVSNPKRFIELIQPVQNDAVYSPPVGRVERPRKDGNPVHYLTPDERELPIIVPPAPIYVDAQPQASQNTQTSGNSNTGARQNATTAPASTGYLTSPNAPPPVEETDIPGVESGSATGSTTVAQYGKLPG